MSEPMEEWRPVVGYEGLYSVSSLGRVRRETDGPPLSRFHRGHIRKPSINRGGYAVLGLTGENRRIHVVTVHRLVAAAFIGPRPDGKQVNHKNGIKTDNRPENLEYVTNAENIQHAVRTGLKPPTNGSRHGGAKLSEEKVRFIRAIAPKYTGRDLAFLFSVSPSVICTAISGRKWSHV